MAYGARVLDNQPTEVTRVSVSSETQERDGKKFTVVKIFQDVVAFPLVRGITGHFALRVQDWVLAAMLFNFGMVLSGPSNMFANPVFAGLARIADEHVWAIFCLVVASIRLAALGVNGTYPRFRWSPHIRATAALLSIFCWFNICLGFWLAEIPTTGIAIYPYILLFDVYNTYLAASEAGDVERRRLTNAAGGNRVH
jgi:hypothetical protein